jgi:hypothetical protein
VSAAIQNQLSAIHRSEVDGISDDMLPYVEAFRTQAAELVAGQSAKVSLNQLSHLSARICNDLRKSVRTRDASVALIARNPEILSASYSTGEEGGGVAEGVVEAFHELVEAALWIEAEAVFMRQFPLNFKPMSHMRGICGRLIDAWQVAHKKNETSSEVADKLRKQLREATSLDDSVFYHLGKFVEDKKLTARFKRDYEVAREAISMAGSFRERVRVAKATEAA